jgi:hypothetical protein
LPPLKPMWRLCVENEEETPEQTLVEQVKESAHWVADMMNKGNVNPKDVYPKGRYSGD